MSLLGWNADGPSTAAFLVTAFSSVGKPESHHPNSQTLANLSPILPSTFPGGGKPGSHLANKCTRQPRTHRKVLTTAFRRLGSFCPLCPFRPTERTFPARANSQMHLDYSWLAAFSQILPCCGIVQTY
jgi:hypothetical protein